MSGGTAPKKVPPLPAEYCSNRNGSWLLPLVVDRASLLRKFKRRRGGALPQPAAAVYNVEARAIASIADFNSGESFGHCLTINCRSESESCVSFCVSCTIFDSATCESRLVRT